MKKRISKRIAFLLIICTVISSIPLNAFALSWDGSSTGGTGGGSPAGANGYAIRTTGDNCIGYRFSVVDKSGNTKNSTVIDVFRNTSYGNTAYGSAYKFNTKYNKKQLMNNQNNGFSTGSTSANCYKEADMGFASGFPTPSGMNSWQSNHNNLNPILSRLGIGSVSSLKNGDKILVEPLFDVRLQSIYHSVTVTELAIYGKYILGTNSDGGSSSNPNSWGFIAQYTNQIYPNSLYTPDGQGLWSGVGSLSKRGTFYTIINSGYGVGIAYTETKPDFTPSLSVYCVEAWPGSSGSRNNNHYGISYGSSFGNYTYGHGYPALGDTVWFAVHFPAESENCYVRQTVWVDGGGSASRNVYSNSNTWYDVSLSPTKVDANRSAYVVKARVDWIDGSGNVKKWGAEKTFYIPIKPTINNYRVTLTDIVGNTSAYGGTGGYGGQVYVGQRINTKYTFTTDNNWTSYNYLRAAMHKWNGSWQRVQTWNSNTGDSDLYVDNAAISSGYSYSASSSLGQIRVPDNSANTNGANRIPFYLWTHWSKDIDHTQKTSWVDIPIIKSDIELLEIDLIDANGRYVTGRNVYAYNTVTPQYVYKNNTNCTVYVNGYQSDSTQISGIYAISAGGTIRVNGKPITVEPNSNTFFVWGGVYLEGAGRGNTSWEKEDFVSQYNNSFSKYWYVEHPLSIEAIAPNSDYRANTEVITSFKIKNAGTTDFIPDNNITILYEVIRDSDSAKMVISGSGRCVIPKSGENLDYLKWRVLNTVGKNYTVKATLYDSGKIIDTATLTRTVKSVASSQIPDTQYESDTPSGWSASSVPSAYKNSAMWSQWLYVNGEFIKKTYGIGFGDGKVSITPASTAVTATQSGDIWNMKSGYGFTLSGTPGLSLVTGTTSPSSSAYTLIQRGYATMPEYNYSTVGSKYRTLALNGTNFCFVPNTNADGDMVHFIPLWYPNGTQNYAVSCYFYDVWTPAGMISAKINTNALTINGSLYDDYYIGRN